MKADCVGGLMETAMENIREMVEVNTIIGDAVETPNGTVIIPVSKMCCGFASGGTDFPSKSNQELFGGGGGAGIRISPVALLVVNNGSVSVKYINAAEGSVERVIGMVPDIVDKATDVISQLKNKDNTVDNAINDYMASTEPSV